MEIDYAPALLAETNQKGMALFSLSGREKYQLEFRKNGYKPKQKTIWASNPERIEVTLQLK